MKQWGLFFISCICRQQPFSAPKMSKPPKMADYIPEEIKLQILHKLPIKCLIRFTCVCKSWLSLIKSQSFISTHLNLSISSPNKTPLLLLRFCSHQHYNNPTEHHSLRFDDQNFNHYMHFHFPFNTRDVYRSPFFRLVGTINGLVCLADRTTYTIIIWNPLVRKSVSFLKPSIIGYYHDVSFGFGFDSTSNVYKVLRLWHEISRNKDEDNLQAEVYSLYTNSWKSIGGVPRYKIKWFERQIFVNGVLHFLAYRIVSGVKFHNLILGFEVGDEVFKEIMLPESLVNMRPLYLNVSVCDEWIAVLEQHSLVRDCGMHVWVMKEYGVIQSWTKIFSFNALASVLGFRKNRELFLQTYTQGIVSLKPENHDIKHFGVRGRFAFVDYFVESLELLDNANAENDYAND